MRQLKLKKRFLHTLRKWCEKLPKEKYTAYPKWFGHTAEEKDLIDVEGEKINPHWMSVPIEYTVNHFRRCKRLFLNYGYFAVEEYFNKRGFLLVDKEGLENEKSSD